jgi:hypothetical protein
MVLAAGLSTALHIGAVIAVCALPAAVPEPREPNRHVTVVLASPREDRLFAGLKPLDERKRRVAPVPENESTLAVGAFQVDIRRIAARMDVLFPVVSPGLAIDSLFRAAPTVLVFQMPASAMRNAARGDTTDVVFSDAAIQSVVDRAWSRRDRWNSFQNIARLLQTHSPAGSVPRVLRAYRQQNALQPYTDRDTRDPRLWTQLELAADHVTFIGFIRDYVSSHPSTEAATELLLLLDAIVQANEDALTVLLDTDPVVDLHATRDSNVRAYSFIEAIRQQYRFALKQRGLSSLNQVHAYYGDVRFALLARVLQTTPNGYAANETRFLMGTIRWSEGRRAEAVRIWRTLSASADGSCGTACEALRGAFGAGAVDQREIDRILKNENGRWLSFSDDRLRGFGYRFDKY